MFQFLEKMGHETFKSVYPACLNCTPQDFVPFTGNLLLIPANMDYYVADALVPILHAVGVNTPNKVTYLNCVLRAVIIYLMFSVRWYSLVTVLLIVSQILDCADGQYARRYKLGSDWGMFFLDSRMLFLALTCCISLFRKGPG